VLGEDDRKDRDVHHEDDEEEHAEQVLAGGGAHHALDARRQHLRRQDEGHEVELVGRVADCAEAALGERLGAALLRVEHLFEADGVDRRGRARADVRERRAEPVLAVVLVHANVAAARVVVDRGGGGGRRVGRGGLQRRERMPVARFKVGIVLRIGRVRPKIRRDRHGGLGPSFGHLRRCDGCEIEIVANQKRT
jgi:hypothetical protein